MGLLNWLSGRGGSEAATDNNRSLRTDSEGLGKPSVAPTRTWVVALRDGNFLCQFEVFQSGKRYQVWCTKGAMENSRCVNLSEGGEYLTLKSALHAILISLGPLVGAVFNSKLQSLNTAEPWRIQEPKALSVADVTWSDQSGTAVPLGQLLFDEETLQIVETLITDPDTNRRCEPPVAIVHVDAVKGNKHP